MGQKCGKITILSKNPDNPAKFCVHEADLANFNLAATVVGEKESQLLYCMKKASYSTELQLQSGSNWSGFEGTLRIADGLRIQNRGGVPIEMPGSVRFGKNGTLRLNNATGYYSLGNLSFEQDGMVSNRATLTV
jgi:hypothetical protein